MYNFSIYINDVIAPLFEDKIKLCDKLHISNMEIDDYTDGRYIIDYNGSDTEDLRNCLVAAKKKIVLVNSSRALHDYDYYKKLFAKAHMLNAEAIRLFISDKDVAGEALNSYISDICRLAQSYGIKALLENCSRTCLSGNNEIQYVYSSIGNDYAGIIFNPLEFVRIKSHPFFHTFYNSKLKNKICFLRVCDGLFADGRPALPGEGNAEIKEMASILLARSFKGYFSYTPYLDNATTEDFAKIDQKFSSILISL